MKVMRRRGGREGEIRPIEGGRFRFACHPGVPCFTECCRDLELILTPYDVLRLSRHLGISSGEFLDRYTEVHPGKNAGLPVLMLRMRDDPKRSCPFLGPRGCEVYTDRPGACRIYPLGRAAADTGGARPAEFYFLVVESHCKGFLEERQWTVAQWREDQGVAPYNAMNDQWMPLATRRPPGPEGSYTPQQMQMYYLASYDLDRFRQFVFSTKFLSAFVLDEEEVSRIRTDDEALLRLAFRWLRFALLREPTLRLREETG